MPSARSGRKIVWAVDAFLTDPAGHTQVIQNLRLLSEKLKATILPTYVLSPDQLNLSIDFSGPWISTYKPAVEKSLQHLATHSGFPNVAQPKIIVKETPSLKNAVKSLCAYAASQGAQLIVAGTQGRNGLSRLMLGSFAESLLMTSKIPILVVGPQARPVSDLRHILFPTDLTQGSMAVFSGLLDLAKELGAKITIHHSVPNPIEPVLQSGVYLLGGGWIPVPMYIEKEKARKIEKAEALVERAKKKGVPASISIDTSSRSVTQSILDSAESLKPDWIAMAAESGPVVSALIGSIARQVVRNAPCPTWILRSSAKKR